MAAAAPLPPKPQPATPESESGRHQTAHDPNGEDGDRRFCQC